MRGFSQSDYAQGIKYDKSIGFTYLAYFVMFTQIATKYKSLGK